MDLVLHFLGGIVIGSVIISLFLRRSDPFLYMAGVVTTITMIVALGWEGYEFFAQIAYARNYIVDTLTDIGFGLAGALTMTIFAHAILNRKKKN